MKPLIIISIIIIILFIKFKKRKKELPIKEKDVKLSGFDYDINNYNKPRVLDNFISEKDCNELIQFVLNSNKLEDAKIGESQFNDKYVRNNRVAWFAKSDHIIMNKINEKLEKLTKLKKNHFENFQFANYRKNEYYRFHHDESPDNDYLSIESSPRIYTALIYLNSDFEGGHTQFKHLNLSIKPKTGRLLLFDNLNKDKNKLHILSEHRGQPLISGNKWIINIWIHSLPSIS